MPWQSTPYVLVLFLAATTSLVWACYGSWVSRREGRRWYLGSFVVLCLAGAVWSGVYAVSLAATGFEVKFFAYKLLHLGAALVPPAWLCFAIAYTGREHWLTWRRALVVAAVPLVFLCALPTNPGSLVLIDARLSVASSLVVLDTTLGPLYHLFLGYSYTAVAAGALLITRHVALAGASRRRQGALLVGGALVPLALNAFEVVGLSPFGTVGVNLTPVSIAVSTVCLGLAIFRYRVLDVVPAAWDVVLSQMSDGVVVLDADERVAELNLTAEAMLEARADALGRDASAVLPQYERVAAESPVLVTLEEADAEVRERIVQFARSPLTRGGETYGWVVLLQDVSAIERERRDAERRNVRLDEFATVVAHDLRNPLALIAGYADLAEETGDPRYFETIRTTAARSTAFLEELLALSRRGETVTDPRPVRLADVVETASAAVPGASLHVDVETDAVVLADENRLRQVFDNLLRNARDHNDAATVVRVGALPDGFYVEDDGHGIPIASREDVFDSGFSTRDGGSGVGLSIVRDVATAHGWGVRITTGTAGGARFEFTGVERVDDDAA